MYYSTVDDRVNHRDLKKEAESLYKEHLIYVKRKRIKLLKKRRRRATLCLMLRFSVECILGKGEKNNEKRMLGRKLRRMKTMSDVK